MRKNQPLRNLIDKIKPTFSKGGKFPWLERTFEGFETFAYTPKEVTTKGSHIRDGVDLKRTMITVVIALVPALLFGMWNIGYQACLANGVTDWTWMQQWWLGFKHMLPMIVVSYGVGLAIEFTFAQVRGHGIYEGYLVSGLIIPMIVPINTPLWQLALACAFAVIFAKEVFGGTGMNFMNPALVARAFLFFAYPSSMSGDKAWILHQPDTFSGATPLADLAALQGPDAPFGLMQMIIGTVPGSIGETSVIAILIGAAILLISGMASWRIMLSVVLGGGLMGYAFNLIGANEAMSLPFYYHFLMGGFMFGAVFMATDPVTSCQTNCGKWVYGLLIGVFTVLIRVLNPTYPEGMMLAILLMNCFAPLIDHLVVARNIKYRNKRMIKG